MRPVKFDFSSYTAAISAIPAIQEQETPLRIAESQELQVTEGKKADLLPDDAVLQNRRIARIAKDYDDFQDDRHHCRECRNIRNGFCIRQQFRPLDEIPRRCEDFTGYPYRIGRSASNQCQRSETAHNAEGRYFKFLITRQDGTQFYSCSMPRMTLKEVREQYPDATQILPVEGEDYADKH